MSRQGIILSVGLWVFGLCLSGHATVELVSTTTLYDGGRQDVSLAGDTLYVASATGLEIFEVSTAGDFRRVGQVIRPDGGRHVAVAGRRVALATASDSVLIFESRLTGSVERVAAFPAAGVVNALSSCNETFYVADRIGWWRIAFTSSGVPQVDFSAGTSSPVHAFGFRGDSLFAVQDDGTTTIYGIAGVPQVVDTVALRPGILSLAFLGQVACAAVGDSGIVVYDFAPSDSATEMGRFFTYGTAINLWPMGTALCVADSARGLLVLTLADPAHPFLLSGSDEPRGPRAFTAWGKTLVAAAANGLFAFDVSDPSRLQLRGRQGGDYHVGDLAVKEGVLAVAVAGLGLSLLDIADPAEPLVISESSFSAMIRGLDLAGEVAGLAAGEDGLVLVDVSAPTAPFLLFRQATVGSARDIALDDSLAAIADGGEGFRIFDVHDPVRARLIGGRSTGSAVIAVARRENFVFAVGPELGMEVYDISFAFKPRRVFAFWPPGISRSITLADQRAFLAVDSGGIFVFDILRPGAPRLLDRLDVVHHPRQVVVDGGLVLVADDSAGVVAIDYRVPMSAQVIANVPFGLPPVSLAYAGDALYASGNSSLYVFAVLPPVVPGDVDGNGSVAVTDAVYLVNFLFRQGPLPFRARAADLNSDGRLNLGDLVRLIRVVFQ